MRSCGAAVALGLLLVATGCGGGDDKNDRPTAEEISKSLRSEQVRAELGQGEGFSKKAADCIGKALASSKVSDAGLRGFIKGDKDFKPSKADTAEFGQVLPVLAACNPVEVP